ncbi:MAG: rhamnulokinase [Promethearchaeota archaeon]
MTRERYLAFDLGATSGRGIVGTLEGGKLSLEEISRFKTGGTQTPTHLYWDVLHFHDEIIRGLKIAAGGGVPLSGVGIDTWGVDYAVLDVRGNLLSNPVHYRDPRTKGEMEAFFKVVPKERLFEITGLQFMGFNSLFQLSAHLREAPYVGEVGASFLHIPDLLNYFLTGRVCSEYTIASTSQMVDARDRDWSGEILEALGVPRSMFPEIIEPGSVVAPLLPHIRKDLSVGDVPVIAPACHDTGSAVAAVPATGEGPWAYISSGTWSLMGVESPVPVLDPAALRENFTNEGGVEGTYRVLKNIQGLWILQQCKDKWFGADPDLTHDAVSRLATEAPPFEHFIFVDHVSFLLPDDMVTAIGDYCERTGQGRPRGVGEIARCVLQSLAFRYRETKEALEALTGEACRTIHVVGGGSRDVALNQFTANATNCRVVAGPTEATAVGNLLVQAMGKGSVRDLADLRGVVRASFPLTQYFPSEASAWEDGYGAYLEATILRESY